MYALEKLIKSLSKKNIYIYLFQSVQNSNRFYSNNRVNLFIQIT